MASRKTVRMQDAETGSEKEMLASVKDFAAGSPQVIDPDAYKEDWEDSIIYKKAMKSEAVKRGRSYDKYEVDDDEDRVEMTATYNQSQLADAIKLEEAGEADSDSNH